jgi:outer membrane protein
MAWRLPIQGVAALLKTAAVVSILIGAIAMGARPAQANDLEELYKRARSSDAVLATATFQRDAAKEAKPQAMAQLLPQISAGGSAERERLAYDNATLGPGAIPNCAPSIDANGERCYANTRGLSLTLSQTLWNVQAYSLAREASSQAAAAEATWRGAEQSLLQTGVGPRSDVEQAQHFYDADFYDATEQSVIDGQNLLDDANLALTQIVGSNRRDLAPLRDDFPLVPPEPASADAWVTAAENSNFDVRAATLRVEAASHDIWAQRGKALPTLALTSSASHAWQDDLLGGNQSEFDLLNAQNNYYAAQRAYAQVHYDYLTSLLTLKQQAGRLTEPDLEQVDALLVVRP